MKPVFPSALIVGSILSLGIHLPAHAQPNATIIVKDPKNKEAIMTDLAKNKEIVRVLFEDIINTGHLERLDQVIGDTYPGPSVTKGPAAFAENIKPLLAAFPDIKYMLEDVIAEGDKVVVRWSWIGTFTGPYQIYPPTQQKLHSSAIVIFQLTDGKIVHGWLQLDRLGFLRQLGAVSPDLGAPPKK